MLERNQGAFVTLHWVTMCGDARNHKKLCKAGMDGEGNRPSLSVTSRLVPEEALCTQMRCKRRCACKEWPKGVECEVLANAQQESFKQKGTRISGFEGPLEGLLALPFPLGNELQHP